EVRVLQRVDVRNAAASARVKPRLVLRELAPGVRDRLEKTDAFAVERVDQDGTGGKVSGGVDDEPASPHCDRFAEYATDGLALAIDFFSGVIPPAPAVGLLLGRSSRQPARAPRWRAA